MPTPETPYGLRGQCEVIEVTFMDGRRQTITERRPGQLFGRGEKIEDVLAAVRRGLEETQRAGRVKELRVQD